MDPVRDIEVLVRAKYPILYVCSWEERRVEEAVKQVCDKLKRTLHTWSVTQGMKPAVNRTSGPAKPGGLPGELEALAQVHEAPEYTVFLMRDFHPYLKDSRVIRLLRDLAGRLRTKAQTLILLSPVMNLPIELEKDVTVLDFPLPGRDDIAKMLDAVIASVKDNPSVDVKLSPEDHELMVKSAQGLTLDETESAFARSLVEHKKLDIDVILEEKKNVIRGSGSLTYVHPEPASNLGGYRSLRAILERAAYTFSPRAKARHVEPCKGILLVGLPGCGKDLCKRVASSITNRALLDLDFGSIMGEGGGVIGSSAMSIKRALSIAGTIKGILGISEFEKAVSGMKSSNKTDGGETARTISYLLNWMQDNKDVLVFATANDVRELESEQFRIGRFSYIHFVDLPDDEDRSEIFRVHLKKRELDPEQFDLEKLVEKSKDFSGAEIEGAVKDGVLEAFIDGDRPAETRDILKAVGSISPTAQMMSEKIEEIRKWAKNNIKGAVARSEGSQLTAQRADRVYEF